MQDFDRARAAGVHGKVSNASDGSVVAYLCGTRRGIEKLVSDRGGLPRSASISEVTLEEADPFIVTPGVSIA
ncbi:acylphosphatase [Brachybacterium paraconglomeratum]|uniref:acylphosphatase n=1 Tax=Brachybacterium paraconglomeratum TaxID=173362 RepID=UPI003CD0B8B5